MSSRGEASPRDLGIGTVLLVASLALLAIYADGQAEHTLRFLAELLVGLGR